MGSTITRREALKRAAWILGGTVSAPTILGVLAGCQAEQTTTAWTARTLTPDQQSTVAALADIIIPETETPGGAAAGVDRFVDAMLSDYYPAKERDRFLSGLARVDARAQRQHKVPFGKLSREQQTAMVLDLDKAAFSEPPAKSDKPAAVETKPEVRKTDVPVGPGAGADPMEAATPDPEDIGPESFFRRMKELTVVGYYTSEIGQNRELRINPWGRYRDIPYKPGTPAWA